MLKKNAVLAVAFAVIGTAVFCGKKPSPSPQVTEEPREKKWMEVYHRNKLKDTVDITYCEPGENFLVFGHAGRINDSLYMGTYVYPWQGEDVLSYRLKNGLLYVNDKLCGVDLRFVEPKQVPDPSSIVTAVADSSDASKLASFPNLMAVQTYDFIDGYLPYLVKLKNLRWLSLSSVSGSRIGSSAYERITNHGLKHLAALTELRSLNISFLYIDGQGLANLKTLSNLKELHIYKTAIKSSDLVHLEAFPKLRVLRWRAFTVRGDVGLKHLAKVPQLEELYLSNAEISDAGLRHLKVLTNLRVLDLSDNDEITNRGLNQLSGLPKLELLDLSDTRVTERGADCLKESLPNLKIIME
ncbi:MAG: hypothetical protein E3J71_04095 [Candidatus Stahlbacteria bacterium]|nr:MAG: hypothetical protein E3J71_04095 [Candidatus Stahlbacteria bacterium]